MPIKYPLQIEIDKDLEESISLLEQAHNCNDPTHYDLVKVARSYYNAIKRINEICKNRNRF